MRQKPLRITFIGILLFLLMSITCIIPVVYADVVEETRITTVHIAYGNGIDDNHDGVIDDMNESDVQYGDVDIDTDESTFDDWPTVISNQVDGIWYNQTIEQGVKMGAVFESEGIILPMNTSISPGYDCKATKQMLPIPGDTSSWDNTSYADGTDISTRKLLPLVKYYITLSPGDVMNGVQELWHRSPIKWDKDIFHQTTQTDDEGQVIIYPEHFINIYKVTNLLDPVNNTQELVFSNSLNDKTHVVIDNRIYTHVNAYLASNVTYAVYEYVGMKNNDPLTNFTMYFAPYQDICNDDITTTIVFPNTTQEQSLADKYGTTIEPSYGIQCIIGIGRVGSEKLVMMEENQDTIIYTQNIPGTEDEDDINGLRVVIPMRTTRPLEINMTLWVESGETIITEYAELIENITGTIIYNFSFSDPNITEPNNYKLRIYINQTSDPLYDGTHYCTYLMVPNIEHSHWIQKILEGPAGNATTNSFPCGFGVHVEITEYEVAPGAEEDHSIWWLDWLVGMSLIGIGMFIDIFLMPTSIIVFIAYGESIGMYFITEGLTYLDSDELTAFWESVLDGAARFRRILIDGLTWVGERLWDIVLTVVETAIWLGEQIAYYGALVLEAIATIIYFAVFIFSCIMFAYFFRILWAIGNLDWALMTVTGKETIGFLKSIYGATVGVATKKIRKKR